MCYRTSLQATAGLDVQYFSAPKLPTFFLEGKDRKSRQENRDGRGLCRTCNENNNDYPHPSPQVAPEYRSSLKVHRNLLCCIFCLLYNHTTWSGRLSD